MNVLNKVNWNLVLKYGGYAVAGITAAVSAIDGAKQADTVANLVKDVAELKKKVNG